MPKKYIIFGSLTMSTASAFLLHERSLSLRFSVVKRVSLRQPPFAVNPLRDRLTRPLSQSETEILHRDWGAGKEG